MQDRINKLAEIGLTYSEASGGYELQDIFVSADIVTGSGELDFASLCAQIKDHIAANPQQYNVQVPSGGAIAQVVASEQKEQSPLDIAISNLSGGSQVLIANRNSASAAQAACKELLAKIQAAGGMNAELFEEVASLRKKISKTVSALNDRRKPFTQAMDLIKTEFTSCENNLKEVEGTAPYDLKLYADEWVRKCAMEKKAEEERLELQRKKQQAIIDLKADIEKRLSEHFATYLSQKKQMFIHRFNGITLDSFDKDSTFFTTVTFAYPSEHFYTFKCNTASHILNDEEQRAAHAEIVTEDRYQQFCTKYVEEMNILRTEKVELLTSKKNELERIRQFEIEQENERKELERIEQEKKTADAARQLQLKAEQDRLEAERKQREDEARQLEQERIERENAERRELEEKQRQMKEEEDARIAAQSAMATTANMFTIEAEKSNIAVAAPKAKTGYEIEVLIPVAWLEVMNFWFQNEGAGWPEEKMRKKFDFMLTAMEKMAMKNGTMLESKNVKYHETYESKK